MNFRNPTYSAPVLKQRLAGGLVGGLVGDALGVPYEFNPREVIPTSELIEMDPEDRELRPARDPHNVRDGLLNAIALGEAKVYFGRYRGIS
jgi:ADP-ribosyl-[dinitrogen reductase] hydrolase